MRMPPTYAARARNMIFTRITMRIGVTEERDSSMFPLWNSSR